jgi:tRNA pseudouridine13 synthase
LIQSTDTFGDMVFLSASTARPELRNLRLPLLGPKTQLAEPWLSAAAAALLDEGIAVEQLRIPGLRRPYFGETERPLFVPAERFTMDEPEPDELSSARRRTKRSVAFDLPRGSYATVVLRALGQ